MTDLRISALRTLAPSYDVLPASVYTGSARLYE